MIQDFLRRILAQVHTAVDEGYYRDFAREHGPAPEMVSLEAAIRRDAPWAFLAELKPISPREGTLSDDAERTRALLKTYKDYGTTGISVLTERGTFGGSLELLMEAAQEARPGAGKVPVLMKDFLVHEDQLDAARAAGASAVLLLHRVLQQGATVWDHPDEAVAAAHKTGLEVLLEVDNPEAFEQAAATKADILGINNRDLGTLEMDPERAVDILRHRLHLVSDTPVLALSGIENRADVLANEQGGATGVLVGTSLMKAKHPRATIRRLRGLAHVKCCGAGHEQDGDEVTDALGGADAVGVVVSTPDAPRQRDAQDARRLFERLPPEVERVLVTTHTQVHELAALVEDTHATHLQWHREATPQELDALGDALPDDTRIITLLRLGEQEHDEGTIKTIIQRAERLSKHADRLLLDAKVRPGEAPGGTGHSTDQAVAARIVKALRPYPVVLAGGITPKNVANVLRTVRPWGVDISSGTEDPDEPGRKAPERVTACLQNARRIVNLDQDEDPTEVDRLRVL